MLVKILCFILKWTETRELLEIQNNFILVVTSRISENGICISKMAECIINLFEINGNIFYTKSDKENL